MGRKRKTPSYLPRKICLLKITRRSRNLTITGTILVIVAGVADSLAFRSGRRCTRAPLRVVRSMRWSRSVGTSIPAFPSLTWSLRGEVPSAWFSHSQTLSSAVFDSPVWSSPQAFFQFQTYFRLFSELFSLKSSCCQLRQQLCGGHMQRLGNAIFG